MGWVEAIEWAAQKIREALQRSGKDAVVVIASPQLTNEDLFVIRKFFGEDLGLPNIDFRVPDAEPKSGDDYLLQADRNPNTRGAEAILLDQNGFNLLEFLNATQTEKLSLLYIFEQDLVRKLGESGAKSFLRRFETVIYQGSNENETSLLADLVLPSATYAETEGTFTNFQGRVQRIKSAVEPLGDSLPTWQIVAKLANALGCSYCYEGAEDIFADLTQDVVEFQGLTYERVGNEGITLADPSEARV